MSKHLMLDVTGHLLRTEAGKLANDCGEPQPTCDIDCDTLASAYTVQGVGSLIACSACQSSGQPAWDGVVERVDDLCRWMLNASASIGGKLPSYSLLLGADCDNPSISNGVGLWFNQDACVWELVIACRNPPDYLVIWAGVKDVQTSPAGVYTRVCGCDETLTLTVV